MKIEKINFNNYKKTKFKLKPLSKTKNIMSNAQVLLLNPCKLNFLSKKININPLVERGILEKNEKSEVFFEEISKKFFTEPQKIKSLTDLLNEGYISLSSSMYKGLINSTNINSAKGVNLNNNNSTVKNLAILEDYILEEVGVGINFSKFDNPNKAIQDINAYFLFRQKEGDIKRPPAGIALLSIYHPKILEFITLKDNENYADWCFDLSVIIPDDFIKKVDNNEDITLTDGTKIKAKKIYETLLNSMLKKGEPGIIFSNNPDYICDCCATAPLKPNEGLTLAHINLAKFYNEDSQFDYEKLRKAANILSQAISTKDKNSYIGILGFQDLLNKAGLSYGKQKANELLDEILKIIKNETLQYGLKMAISPTGTISRILKTTPSIEPNRQTQTDYLDELETMKTAQKYLEGNISKTIELNSKTTTKDVDIIIRKAQEYNLKGISVFNKQ